jgi:cell division protein DivIC
MKENTKKSTKKRTVKLTTIALLAIVLFFMVKGIMLQPQINENYDIISELEAQIEYEEQRADEVDALKEIVDSDEYIEKIAREKLGMIRKDEIVFVDITGEE